MTRTLAGRHHGINARAACRWSLPSIQSTLAYRCSADCLTGVVINSCICSNLNFGGSSQTKSSLQNSLLHCQSLKQSSPSLSKSLSGISSHSESKLQNVPASQNTGGSPSFTWRAVVAFFARGDAFADGRSQDGVTVANQCSTASQDLCTRTRPCRDPPPRRCLRRRRYRRRCSLHQRVRAAIPPPPRRHNCSAHRSTVAHTFAEGGVVCETAFGDGLGDGVARAAGAAVGSLS